MTEIIRIFDSSQNAAAAADELRANNFADVRVDAGPAPTGQPANDATGTRTQGGMSGDEPAADVAARTDRGAVLRVEVPFGRGQFAEAIIGRHGPSRPVRSDRSPTSSWSAQRGSDGGHGDVAAPFSSALGLPVLTDPKPTTVNSLGDQSPTFTSGLLSSDFYVSSLFGMPLLTNPTPRATLIDNPAPLSSMLGLPLLLHPSPAHHHDERRTDRQVDHNVDRDVERQVERRPAASEVTEIRSRVG